MNILSLFDGISCARVAFERAGIKVDRYYASEIDKYAIKVSQKNWPDIIQVGDVKNIVIGKNVGNGVCTFPLKHIFNENKFVIKENIDLLIGGSPCQDLSIAKKDRKGLSGERSGLFYEYVRILRETQPKWFILENVASMPKEAKEAITKELGVEPIMINAALVSAQNRKRLFWTNIPNVCLPEDKGILLRDVLEEKVDESFYVKDKSNTIRTSGRGSGADDKHNWDTIRIGKINKGGQGDRIYSIDGKSVNLSANGGGRGAKTGLYCISSTQKHATISKDKSTPIPAAAGMGGGHCPMITEDFTEVRKLTPIECERLQCLDDNYTSGISNTQRYKCLGNAFNVDVVAHILYFIK